MSTLILMYHDLGLQNSNDQGHSPYILDPKVFDSQMSEIKKTGHHVLTLSEWVTCKPTQRSIVLTFDDGHVSNYEWALPILMKYQLKATFFVTAGDVGKSTTLTWTQMREMQARGMEIGSHTLTHRPPSLLSDEELRYELEESRKVLEYGLGTSVDTISSPTGFFNPRMVSIAREVGYRALCFGRIGIVNGNDDPLALKRISIKASTSTAQFRDLIHFNSNRIWRLRANQWVRDCGKKVLSPSRYLKVRRIIMNQYANLFRGQKELTKI